ncbi:MAG: hypothetical protein ABII18_07035, partial [bacterium]
NSMVTPFHAPVTWSLSASMTLNEGSSLQTGFLDSATRDVDQYQKLSFTDSLDLVIPQKLMQQPMPSVLRRMPTPVAEVLALAPAPAPAPAPAEQKGFRIEKLSLFIEQISSMHAQDPVSAKSKLTGALEILFEFKEKNPEMLEFLFDIPDGALEMGDFTQDDLGLWFDILRDENIQGNLNSTVSFSDLSRLSDVCGRMVRSSEMNAPSVMQLPNMRRLLSALRRLVKPEVVLFLDRAQYALVGKAIKEHSLLAQFPNQAKRIASLIEMSLYETRVAYKEQEISMLKLFDLCSQENKKALADSLLAIINTASPRQTEALIEFMLVRCPILGFNSSIDNLIQVIEDSSGGRVQVISNNHFLAASVKKIVTDLRSSMELSSESFVFDDAGEFASLELSSIMEAFELLGKLLVYNPSFEFLNVMIRECVSPKSHNPMMWLLKNIPKRTMTRDARRYFGSYILMTFKQYLLGKFSPHNEWDAQLIGAFDALDREWAHSHAARALAQDEETREDVAMQAELLAEEALRLSTDGHDHYRELKKLGYQFSSFEEFKEKYQVLKNLFNVFVKCINRNLPSREAQQDTALAFIEFCRIMSNFATLLPELEIDVLLSQLQIMKKERGQKEFLLAADIRAFTEQLKQIALERFFEKSSLSEKTQQTIRSAISDPNNPLSDIRLLNQIIAYHGFQTEKGQQAVEELLESLTVEQKRKKG